MVWLVDCGIVLDVVVGYSVGEIIVFYVVGVLLLVEVMCIVWYCGCIM